MKTKTVTLRNYSGLPEGSEGRIIIVNLPDQIEDYQEKGFADVDLALMVQDKLVRCLNEKVRICVKNALEKKLDIDAELEALVPSLESYIFVGGRQSSGKKAEETKATKKAVYDVLIALKDHDKKAYNKVMSGEVSDETMDKILITPSVERIAEILNAE